MVSVSGGEVQRQSVERASVGREPESRELTLYDTCRHKDIARTTMSPNQRAWNTSFTRAFRCRLPLISAPMADVSGGLLAAEVTRAGGLGMIGAGHCQDLAELEAQIEIFEGRIARGGIVDAAPAEKKKQ